MRNNDFNALVDHKDSILTLKYQQNIASGDGYSGSDILLCAKCVLQGESPEIYPVVGRI